MIAGESPFHPPATAIGVEAVPRRHPVLRWIAAAFCGICSVVPFFFTYKSADFFINTAMAFGWRHLLYAPPGPTRRIALYCSLIVIAASGPAFLLAGRGFVVGRARRASAWFLAGIVAGCFLYFPLNARL